MRISLVQSSPRWGDPAGSRARIDELLKDAGETDLIVLPEMFSTGFVTHPESLAEPSGPDGWCESLRWMQETAAGRSCAVAGSIALRLGDSYRNRFFFVFPDGNVTHYDKHHLFTYAGEDRRFTGGTQRVVVPYGDFRILLQVCYDLRFPVFSRNRITPDGPDYDLILYVASWPDVRVSAWDTLLKARAIENLSFVAGINRVGEDPGNQYSGHSVLLGPDGSLLSNCKKNFEEVVTTEISKASLNAFRKSFPALLDADL